MKFHTWNKTFIPKLGVHKPLPSALSVRVARRSRHSRFVCPHSARQNNSGQPQTQSICERQLAETIKLCWSRRETFNLLVMISCDVKHQCAPWLVSPMSDPSPGRWTNDGGNFNGSFPHLGGRATGTQIFHSDMGRNAWWSVKFNVFVFFFFLSHILHSLECRFYHVALLVWKRSMAAEILWSCRVYLMRAILRQSQKGQSKSKGSKGPKAGLQGPKSHTVVLLSPNAASYTFWFCPFFRSDLHSCCPCEVLPSCGSTRHWDSWQVTTTHRNNTVGLRVPAPEEHITVRTATHTDGLATFGTHVVISFACSGGRTLGATKMLLRSVEFLF